MTWARLSSRGNACGSDVRLAVPVAGLVEVHPGARPGPGRPGPRSPCRRRRRAGPAAGRTCPGWSSHGLRSMVTLAPNRPKPSVGPVADLAVAHPDQVGQAVAGHVRQVDGLLGIGEHQPRSPLLAPRVGGEGPPAVAEAVEPERRVPGEGVVAGDQHVGEAVSVQVDHAQVRVVPGDVRAGPERAERLPAVAVGTAGSSPASGRRARPGPGARRRPGRAAAAVSRARPRPGCGGEHPRRREPAPAQVGW